MKRILIPFLLIVMLIGGCTPSAVVDSESLPADSTSSSQSVAQFSPVFHGYDFESYEEMQSFPFLEKLQEEVNEGNLDAETYQDIANQMSSGQLPIPCQNGQPMALRTPFDQPLISFLPHELYEKAWLWYRTVLDDQLITVCIMLDQELLKDLPVNASGSEIIRHIYPTAPNVDNYQKFENYKVIADMKIETSDGPKAVLFRQESSRDRVYFSFIQNGYLVKIFAPENTVSDEWLQSFSVSITD